MKLLKQLKYGISEITVQPTARITGGGINLKKCSIILLGFNALLISNSGFSQQKVTKIDRYISVHNRVICEQADLLNQTFQVTFPQNIQKVDGAVRYLLRFSGYSLADKTITPNARYMLSRALPHIQRELGPLSLKDGLTVLAGNTFQLLVDPVHRLISFKEKGIYTGNYHLYSAD